MTKLRERQILALANSLNLLQSVYKIVEIVPPGEKKNEIYLIYKNNYQGYVLKLLTDTDILIGEESIFDIMYDSYVHELIVHKHPEFAPSRQIIAINNSTDNIFNRPYAIQSLVSGERPKVSDKLQNERLLNTITKIMLKYHLNSETSNIFGTVSTSIFKNNNITLDQDLVNEIRRRKNKEKALGFSKYVTRYFKADVNRETDLPFKQDLLEYINMSEGKLSIPKYHLIHADIKPSNTLVNKNRIHLIDWSRAHFGDIAIDFADIILSMMVYVDLSSAIKAYTATSEYFNQHFDTTTTENLDDRIRYYISLKLFSIARIFYPAYMQIACKGILSPAVSLISFIKDQTWVEDKYF